MATRIAGTRTSAGTWPLIATCLSLVVLLTACAGGAEGTNPDSASAPPGFPITITNCGVTTTYEQPPERAVTMNQHATEIMLALGLADRMVGTAWSGDSSGILAEYRDEYRRIPVLAEEYPSYEVLLKSAPDFVYAGYDSAFTKQEGRSRKRLTEAGIDTHLNVQDCTDGAVTMNQLWQELRTVAKIFGVPQRAEKLIGTLEADLNRAKRKLAGVDPVSVFVYDSGTKVPMTAGGRGMAGEILRLAGGRNVFADFEDAFGDVSWEQVIQRKPETIVILDYGDTAVPQKKQVLLGKPTLAGVPAVRERRFAVLPLTSAVAGIRAPRAVAELGEQLHSERFR